MGCRINAHCRQPKERVILANVASLVLSEGSIENYIRVYMCYITGCFLPKSEMCS